MSSKQRNIMWAINLFGFVWLLYYITHVTKAYIGMAYPYISDTTVSNLITIPNFIGLIFSFLIGPFALKRSKVKLAAVTLLSIFIYCLIFYLTGLLHGPFWLLIIACFFAGYGQGTYVPLLNGIISEHFPIEQRGERIANYNVAINLGAVIILQLSGVIAARNDGTTWYNAYLLGIAAIIGTVIFVVVCKKYDADTPAIINQNAKSTGESHVRDIPGKVMVWVLLMGVLHCLFYIAQFAFNTNVSSYIITEYKLGTAAQAGTATSLVRISLIVFTAMYPFLKKRLKNWMIPLGYLSVGVGLLIMMNMKSLIGVYLCACFIGLATALSHSTLLAKASEYVPIALVPVSMSLVWGVANIGSSTSVYTLQFFAKFLGADMAAQLMTGVIISVIASVAAVYMYVIKKPIAKG